MRVLGIDPGNKRTAFALVSDVGPEWLRDFTLDLHRKTEAEQMQVRMRTFYTELDRALQQFPDVALVAISKQRRAVYAQACGSVKKKATPHTLQDVGPYRPWITRHGRGLWKATALI